MNKKVFVYGSLKQGHGNNRLLEGTEFLGVHNTECIYTMVSLGRFPGVIPKGDMAIKGEVYDVAPEQFERLDILEGYPSFYNRIEIPTPYGNAWMYILDDTYLDHKQVEGGEW